MSERTTSAVSTQSLTYNPAHDALLLDAYSNGEEELAEYLAANPAPVAAPVVNDNSAAAARIGAALAAALDATPVPTVTVEQCSKTLAAFSKAAKDQAEVCYTLAKHAMQYVRQSLAASPKAVREVATDTLANALFAADGDVPLCTAWTKVRSRYMDRVSVLIGCQAVIELLGDGTGIKKGDGTGNGRGKGKADGRLVWRTLREFRGLVERDSSSRDETWHIIPHVATEAKELLAEVAVSGLATAAVSVRVSELIAKSVAGIAAAKLEAAKLASQAELLAAKEKLAAAAERDAKAAKVTQATVVAIAAEAKVANATDEAEREAARQEAAVATETLVASKAELLTTQATVVAATEAEAKAAADKARLEQEAKEAAAKQVDADAKAAVKGKAAKGKKTADATPAAPTAPVDTREEPKHGNILRSAAVAGCPKDVADMAVELVTGGDAPDDVFAALLRLLDGHADLSKASHRAVKAALLSLHNSDTQRTATVVLPTAIAERNGNGVHAKTA